MGDSFYRSEDPTNSIKVLKAQQQGYDADFRGKIIHCVQKKTPTHIFFHISMNDM